MIERAIEFAAKAHSGQTDKNGTPYIFHPLRVMENMRKNGFGEVFQIIAVLHDVVEDNEDGMIDIVRNQFGDLISESVDVLTRKGTETYWYYFIQCTANNIPAWVKLYDILDHMDMSRFNHGVPYDRYIKCLKWYKEKGFL